MIRAAVLVYFCLMIPGAFAATFGSVTTVVGSVGDIVLDEGRRRLYAVNSNANRLEVYSLSPGPIRLTTTISLDALPLSAALSVDKSHLYVVCHNASSINVVDLETLRVVDRPSLPARPEGIAIGNDGRALISTIGTGAGNAQNILLIYDPNNNGSIDNVVFTPTAPTAPPGAPPAGRAFLANRSQLLASPNGDYIVGVNLPNTTQRLIFVYEVASATVLRSRFVNNVSSVLTVAPDTSKFMSGLTLFDFQTLEVIAQQNLANAPYPIPTGTNFNTQQNQGGSVFSPDGSVLYSAFNIAPVQNPAARPNVGQLMLNDPDNLLIKDGYQMPENLAGKMVMTSDGSTIYAISESGFASIPIGTAKNFPIATTPTGVVLLANDQCGVTSDIRSQNIPVGNAGRGRLTATAQVLQQTTAGPAGLGGAGGPGGGLPGGGAIIIFPPVVPGFPGGGGGAQIPGVGNVGTNTAAAGTAPQVRTQNTADGPLVTFTYNQSNARTTGTVAAVDFLLQSNEAINIPPRLRVFQNNRDSDARTDIRTLDVGVSSNEALEDILYDATRSRVYIANSGMNRIEVLDATTKEFLPSIKVGQLPRSMAISPDNNTMYVANTGGESISVVDLNQGAVVGKLKFPPLPFNATAALVTPSIIVATTRGPLVMMNNGSIWRGIGGDLVPNTYPNEFALLGTATLPQPRTMTATPNGEYAMILAGNGNVYLYDAVANDFVQARQIFTPPIQGYFGPVSAGPGGRYFLVNGTVLNPALTPTGSAGAVQVPGRGNAVTTTPRPVSAVTSLNNTTFVRFTQPIRAQAGNVVVSDNPVVEIADAATGNTMRSVTAVEGPTSTVTGTARANVSGRAIAVDPGATTAYLITTSGLSIVPLDAPSNADRPVVNPQNSVVNIANGKTNISPGSIVTISGRNLADTASAGTDKFPTLLGGVCVTLNNNPIPLAATAQGQINALIPSSVAAGRYPLMIRNVDKKVSSLAPVTVTLSKYAPAVMVDPQTKQAAIYDADGKPVTKNNPTTRDRRLNLFAVGLGPTKGATIVPGLPTPASPDATTDPVLVFFGDPRYKEAAIAVEKSTLAPGLIGVYQIQLYVPGAHLKGDALDVTVRIGGIDSPTKGDLDPKIAVN